MKQRLLNPTKNYVVFAFIVATIAQMADYLSTVYAMAHGAEEANPIVANVIAAGGNDLFFVYKLTGIALFTALGYWSRTMAALLATPFLYISYQNLVIGLEMARL